MAIKATLGYEYVKFKDAFFRTVGSDSITTGPVGTFNDQKAVVKAVRVQLQIRF